MYCPAQQRRPIGWQATTATSLCCVLLAVLVESDCHLRLVDGTSASVKLCEAAIRDTHLPAANHHDSYDS